MYSPSFGPLKALPQRVFKASACSNGVDKILEISLDIYHPPILIDFAKTIEPSIKIEIEVLPDPISRQTAPECCSSLVKVDKAETYGLAVKFITFKKQFFTIISRLCRWLGIPYIKSNLTPSLFALIPFGLAMFLIPSAVK